MHLNSKYEEVGNVKYSNGSINGYNRKNLLYRQISS